MCITFGRDPAQANLLSPTRDCTHPAADFQFEFDTLASRSMYRIRLLIAGLVLALCCPAQDPPRIRVNVSLVNVALTVRDASGALVTNLTKDDFEVFDDGVPQAISYFARSADLPLTLGLIVDISGSQEHSIKRHQHDLEVFLKNVLTPHDRAFVLCFANHLRIAADFSPSVSYLIDALRRSDHGSDLRAMPELGPTDMRELGTAFYDALYYATTIKLAGAEGGRKALIMFSDGEDNSSAHDMLDAIEAAQKEDVAIFGVRYTEPNKKVGLTARNKYGIRVMERISKETGGIDFDAEKVDLERSFRQIGEELRSSYELAYHATNSAGDGTFHKLVIRAKQQGLTVRTKTGYFSGN
jgi:Ca-activated chloride channel homolog